MPKTLPPSEAFVLHVDGSKLDLPLREPTLEELQGFVGGYIEVIYLSHPSKPCMMVLNEEGKLKGLKVNNDATLFARFGGLDPSDMTGLSAMS